MKTTVESLAAGFPAGAIGSSIRYLDTVDSTNRLALELPDAEAIHGLVLVAGEQTAGRGRQGRKWLSLPGIGLHFTTVLRRIGSGRRIALLTMAGALAVYDALRSFCRSPLDIRWPNDVLLAGGKVSGVLGEAAYEGRALDRIALGISINVGHRPEDFPPGMPTRPTSILIAEGKSPPLHEVLRLALEGLNRWYSVFVSGDFDSLIAEFENRSSCFAGRQLAIIAGEERIEGTASGIDSDGSLRLRLPSGAEVSLRAGEVRVLGDDRHEKAGV